MAHPNVCEKHKESPVVGLSPCPGCEIENIRRVRDQLHAELSAYKKRRDGEVSELKSENEELKKDAERYRWLRDKAPKIPFATPLMAMFTASGQLMHRLEGPPLLMSGEKADFVIDQAAMKYTDAEIEAERGRQQEKIDAAITTLSLSYAMLHDDSPIKKALLVPVKAKE